ncbi:amidohydrolase [Sphingobium chlorophenolicum]|uniref:Amidohydrolase n=1 Tax=Sphingobium chlorophenolicum TaxID=46429 RepID=A0A081RBQ8_SPHCR|nr:amidohydrolase [Sphingobium chlorophenolicum]KEQ52631.1 Amidohydrolase precursor [Sphingobium chlorophenolicum]
MKIFKPVALAAALATTALAGAPAHAQAPQALKDEVAVAVEAQRKQIQVMVDQIYSFAEPGFQEVKTSEYLTGILEKNGFKVERGVAGIPTAFTATWGTEGPKIALGSDIDGLLGVSQMPGVAEMKPLTEDAPGHGEGHNSGMPLMVAAALAAKQVMIKHGLKGRLMLWPGVAEELLGSKAYYVRAGMFKDVDASIFAHVYTSFSTGWGDLGLTGMISVEYEWKGRTAHAAGKPWEGRSALDAAELMDVMWNFRREHLPPTQRSHNVITNGGGQPNVVPDRASSWYYFREKDFASLRNLYEIGNQISEAAAMATGTTVSRKVLGFAAPNVGNKPLAEALYANIETVGMPQWSAADQAFARAVQVKNHLKVEPLAAKVGPLSTPELRGGASMGGSDDIGDVMWTVPTVTIGYPANIPNVIFHHATAGMAMATPIAHKGTLVGAKAVAMTILDLVTTPQLITDAKAWMKDVQLKDQKYDPLIAPTDMPAIDRNARIMAQMRPTMQRYYYNPKAYDSYLKQLGVDYEAAGRDQSSAGK